MADAVLTYVNPKSADRVLDILELVAASPDGMSRTEITARLGLPKSSASVLLRSLVGRAYLQASADGRRLTIGVRAFETGSGFLRQMSMRDIARAAMDDLVRELGQTCHLAVLAGRDVVYLDKVDPPHAAVQLVTSIGARLAAAGTAVGLAQLAFLGDRELEERYREAPRDDAALDKVRASRRLIRKRGWACERGETTPGVGCVAAPIFDHDGVPIGAVGATYLEATARGFDLASGPRLRETALDISRRSGFAAKGNGDGTTTRHTIKERVL
jgi:IclR family transcriptional regulator, KDG regulon repressor